MEKHDTEHDIKEALSPLTQLQPDAALRSRNRARLYSAAAASRRPWYSRSIQVPLPAAAIFIAVLVGLGLLQVQTQSNDIPVQQTAPANTPAPKIETAAAPAPSYDEHGVFVGGVGVISRTIAYHDMQENQQ